MDNKVHILYAEDDADTARITAAILENAGFRVTCVGDGEAAWRAFQERKPDIVLLDWQMPGMDGMDVLRLVAGADPAVPVILHTSHAAPANEARAFSLGAREFVGKDCYPEVLVSRLRNVCGQVCRERRPSLTYRLSSRTLYDRPARLLSIDGRETVLKPLDATLLGLLCAKCNEVVERQYLLEGMWGRSLINKEKELKKYVSHVRSLLAPDPSLDIRSEGQGRYCLLAPGYGG